MSSAKQESSPAQQRREIVALAEQKGFEIIDWYVDEGISGDEIEKRPDFRRMLADAHTGRFKVILCWDQDRFGRFDSLRAGYVIEPLRQAGIRLVTVTQGEIDWNDFAGRMIYAIQQEGKNQYLVNLSQNVLRGCIQVAREGHGASHAAYGYDRVFYDESGKLVHRVSGSEHFSKPKQWKAKLDISTNEQEVETLRYIFDRYANSDANTRSIAAELNARGIRTRTGRLWSGQSIRVILRNPVYVGTMIYGKKSTGRFSRVGNGGVGGDGPVVVENAHSALIDRETFNRAQKKLRARAVACGRSRSNGYLLTGLLVCGRSGIPFSGRRSSVGNRVAYYFRSIDKPAPDGPDECFLVRKDALEAFVMGKMIDLLENPAREERLRKAVLRKLKSRRRPASDLQALKTRLRALDKKIADGAERLLLLDAEDLADASKALANWRAERRRVAAEVERVGQGTETSPEAEVGRVMAELGRLRHEFDSADPAKVRAALRTTIESITLFFGPGGRRKWKLERGVIRLRDSRLVLATGPSRSTRTGAIRAPQTSTMRAVSTDLEPRRPTSPCRVNGGFAEDRVANR